jgi:RNA polymerase sigma-70 factor (ECF subfamily)
VGRPEKVPTRLLESSLDDAWVLNQARNGAREQAFTTLYERHKDAVFGFLLRVLRDRALAEDVLQESFYRLYRSLDRCDPERPFKPYLYQIVQNAMLDALAARKKAEDAAVAARNRVREQTTPLVEVAARDEEARARTAYDALPEETRLLLYQRHGLDMKLDDLASAWSVTERTVRNRLKAAARELVKLFQEGGRRE